MYSDEHIMSDKNLNISSGELTYFIILIIRTGSVPSIFFRIQAGVRDCWLFKARKSDQVHSIAQPRHVERAMDLLSAAYGASSDDEEAESGRLNQLTLTKAYSIPPPKRHRSDISPPQYHPNPPPSLSLADRPHRFPPPGPTDRQPPLLPGRYISKRERERSILSASSKESETPIFPSTSAGTSPGDLTVF